MPFHKQSGYQQLPVIDGSCPVSDHACKEIISLLTGSYLSFTAQIRISEAVHKALDPPEEIDQIGFLLSGLSPRQLSTLPTESATKIVPGLPQYRRFASDSHLNQL